MASGWRIALWLIILGFPAAAGAAQPAIQFAEPVNFSTKASVSEFDAYGRRFTLSLVGNERVLQKLSAAQKGALSSYRLLRGSVAGAPHSWVRLTETPQGVEGAIWDGQDFYAVTRYENIAPFLTTPLDAAPGQTVVYRLSDARNALPRDFCALDTVKTDAPTALDQYKEIVAEIQGGVVGPSIAQQIEISLIADSAFQQSEGNDPTAAMLARLNIVEGIFSEQVGLLIIASDIRLIAADADPFTSTKGTTLLEQLSAYRSTTPAVRARGVAHLMTGKDLDGTTAGIAYVRTVCERERGVSLSQRSYGTTISALIMAHELGHNFGASHDGEAGTPCANTSAGFIMASSVTGYGTFSQCSIDTMKPVLASASCVTPAEFADLSLDTGVESLSGEGGVPFTLPFIVRSKGNIAAESAEVTVTLPGSTAYSLNSVTSSQGSCALNGFTATCALGTLEAASSAQVSITGVSSAAANFTAQARVTAANDQLTSNNNRQLTVNLRSGIDARIALSPSAGQFALGAPIEVYADVSSRRALSVRNATVSVNLNQPVTGATLEGGSCTVNASSVVCAITEIPSGTTRRLTVSATAQTAGSLYASASATVSGDGDLTNNNAGASGWVQAERDVSLSAPEVDQDVAVGSVVEIPYTVKSRGALPTGDVELLITVPGALVMDSLDAGASSCSHPSDYVWRCSLGAMAAGESRTVVLRVYGVTQTTGDIAAVVIADADGYSGNNSINMQLRCDHQVDLGVVMASGGSGIDGEPFEGQVALRSNGRLPATGAVLDVTLHSAGVLQAATIHNGAACAMLSGNRARCPLPTLARSTNLYVDYRAQFEEPGDYDITFALTTPGDSAPGNDSLTRPVLVRPYLDASVAGSLDMRGMFGGQIRVQTFTVTTGRRALPSARFLAAHAPPALRVDAISSAGADCRVDDDLGGICDFTDLPAGASLTVAVTYRALDGWWLVDPMVSVSAPGDVVSTNNVVTGQVETLGTTDLELRVDGSMGGPKGGSLSFPTIQLINGGNKAMTPRLDVTLPPGVSVVGVSASDAVCSGTTSLRCDFNTLEPFAQLSVSLSVRATVNGSFTSQVKVSAANDINPANDARDVALEIGGASSAVNEGSKGGGGRIEWFALAFLLAHLLRKRVFARLQPTGTRSHRPR